MQNMQLKAASVWQGHCSGLRTGTMDIVMYFKASSKELKCEEILEQKTFVFFFLGGGTVEVGGDGPHPEALRDYS